MTGSASQYMDVVSYAIASYQRRGPREEMAVESRHGGGLADDGKRFPNDGRYVVCSVTMSREVREKNTRRGFPVPEAGG